MNIFSIRLRSKGLSFAFCMALSLIILTGCDTTNIQPDEGPEVSIEGIEGMDGEEWAGKHGQGRNHDRNNQIPLIIEFKSHMTTDEVEASAKRIVRRYGLRKRHVYKYTTKGVAGKMNPRAIEALLNNPSDRDKIKSVRPDHPFEVGLSASTTGGRNVQVLPWGIDHIDADLSSTVAGDGQGAVPVDVYVIDSGVSHSDVNVVEAIDFRDVKRNRVDPADDYGHGTHIAGTIAAFDDDLGVVGAAPGARVHNLKVLSADGSGQFSDVLAALDYVMAQKVENPTTPMVVNLSLGADVGDKASVLDEGVQRAIDQGITVVVAAGNDGIDIASVTPARVAGAITVGAYDQAAQFASFSNYGSGVDILAPGVAILSLANNGAATVMDGTSMAAAHVSGAAALYLSQHPDASPAAVQQALLEAAVPAHGAPSGTTNLRLSMLTF